MEDIRQRSTIQYDLKELTIIQKESQILSQQIEVKSLKGINKIFENQDECGKEVRNIFNNKSIINCLVYGMTQTGKTGCMTSLIQYYILSNNIPIDNIYIITGLSDKEWKKDTKNRMPDSINDRVFHRANLPKTFTEDIKEKKNFLIIMDEIQIACEESQTIYRTFKECGFYDLDFLLVNDIKLIQFSATPDGNINDISDWQHYSTKVKLSPGINHYGPKQALNQNRIKQFQDLTKEKNVLDLKSDIQKFSTNRYHLIRVPNKRENNKGSNNQSIVIANFKKVFGPKYEYNLNYLETKKKDINDILINVPQKHTFIFYCEILRCAKTQYKKYIGISYERFSFNINDSTIIQGSFGRLTGYDDNGDSICYTNISSLENYIKLWDNNMEFKKGIKWNTKTTYYDSNDDITYSNGTFNSVTYINKLKKNCSIKLKIKREEDPIIEQFNHQDDMIKWFNDNLKKNIFRGKRGPQRRKPRIEDPKKDFYEGTIRKVTKVFSIEEVNKEKRWGFKKSGSAYRSYPCYLDVNDIKTLQWLLIYYEK